MSIPPAWRMALGAPGFVGGPQAATQMVQTPQAQQARSTEILRQLMVAGRAGDATAVKTLAASLPVNVLKTASSWASRGWMPYLAYGLAGLGGMLVLGIPLTAMLGELGPMTAAALAVWFASTTGYVKRMWAAIELGGYIKQYAPAIYEAAR